jgi:hypothetical protein
VDAARTGPDGRSVETPLADSLIAGRRHEIGGDKLFCT